MPACRQHARAGLAAGSGAPARTPPTTPASKATPGSSATYLEYVKPLIEAYSEAVALGTKRVLHALPRLLTALLEFGSDAVLVKQATLKSPRPPMLDTLTSAMRKQTDKARRCPPPSLPAPLPCMPWPGLALRHDRSHAPNPVSCTERFMAGAKTTSVFRTDGRGAHAYALSHGQGFAEAAATQLSTYSRCTVVAAQLKQRSAWG